ncbi:hypothetical protein MNV49_005506 [Pseudohyphozyma bogoriensis]|nr:hypothetical protein MNV49_005506 [Pseudohyphozyma bogoriensis]
MPLKSTMHERPALVRPYNPRNLPEEPPRGDLYVYDVWPNSDGLYTQHHFITDTLALNGVPKRAPTGCSFCFENPNAKVRVLYSDHVDWDKSRFYAIWTPEQLNVFQLLVMPKAHIVTAMKKFATACLTHLCESHPKPEVQHCKSSPARSTLLSLLTCPFPRAFQQPHLHLHAVTRATLPRQSYQHIMAEHRDYQAPVHSAKVVDLNACLSGPTPFEAQRMSLGLGLDDAITWLGRGFMITVAKKKGSNEAVAVGLPMGETRRASWNGTVRERHVSSETGGARSGEVPKAHKCGWTAGGQEGKVLEPHIWV